MLMQTYCYDFKLLFFSEMNIRNFECERIHVLACYKDQKKVVAEESHCTVNNSAFQNSGVFLNEWLSKRAKISPNKFFHITIDEWEKH